MHFNALKFRRLIKCNFIPNRVFPTSVHSEENEEKCDRCSSFLTPRGLLRLTDLRAGSLVSLFTCLFGLELEYNELEMVGPTSSQPRLYVLPIVYACGKAFARLKLSLHFCEPQCHVSRTHSVAPFNTTIFQCPPISLSRIAQDYANSYSLPIQRVCNQQHSPS